MRGQPAPPRDAARSASGHEGSGGAPAPRGGRHVTATFPVLSAQGRPSAGCVRTLTSAQTVCEVVCAHTHVRTDGVRSGSPRPPQPRWGTQTSPSKLLPPPRPQQPRKQPRALEAPWLQDGCGGRPAGVRLLRPRLSSARRPSLRGGGRAPAGRTVPVTSQGGLTVSPPSASESAPAALTTMGHTAAVTYQSYLWSVRPRAAYTPGDRAVLGGPHHVPTSWDGAAQDRAPCLCVG